MSAEYLIQLSNFIQFFLLYFFFWNVCFENGSHAIIMSYMLYNFVHTIINYSLVNSFLTYFSFGQYLLGYSVEYPVAWRREISEAIASEIFQVLGGWVSRLTNRLCTLRHPLISYYNIIHDTSTIIAKR